LIASYLGLHWPFTGRLTESKRGRRSPGGHRSAPNQALVSRGTYSEVAPAELGAQAAVSRGTDVG
jgi:hypothetical protein